MSMTRTELFEFQKKTFDNLLELTRKKNADYSGSGNDAFKNFNLVQTFGCVTTEQGFFTRMVDKIARISSFIENGQLQVKDESVTDTLMDLANYSILFAAYLEGKKSPAKSLAKSDNIKKDSNDELINNTPILDSKTFDLNYLLLRKFLESKNIFSEWINEVTKAHKLGKQTHFVEDIAPSYWIDLFPWHETSKGRIYWQGIDYEWRHYCAKEKLVSHINKEKHENSVHS